LAHSAFHFQDFSLIFFRISIEFLFHIVRFLLYFSQLFEFEFCWLFICILFDFSGLYISSQGALALLSQKEELRAGINARYMSDLPSATMDHPELDFSDSCLLLSKQR
jgi:hypothetical protein